MDTNLVTPEKLVVTVRPRGLPGLGLRFVLDRRCEVWHGGPLARLGLAQDLRWPLIRHDDHMWMIRYRSDMLAVLFDRDRGGIAGASLEHCSRPIEDGWEVPLEGLNTFTLKLDYCTLHFALQRREDEAMPPTLIIAEDVEVSCCRQ